MKQIFAAALACLLLGGCASRNAPVRDEPSAASQTPALPVSSAPEMTDAPSAPEPYAPMADGPARSEPAPFVSDGSAPAQEGGPQAQPTEDWMLMLANYDHPIGDYEPELAMVSDPYRMDARVAPIMRQMIEDARAQGVELLVCSAYRPYSSQERNFNNSVNSYMAQGYSKADATALTARLIAEPGKSEHQTGLAADIVTPAYQNLDAGYADTAAAKWLAENAADYGFILRYPKDKTEITRIDFEPWHYRYVGSQAAREIMDNGLCLEEYLGAVPDGV